MNEFQKNLIKAETLLVCAEAVARAFVEKARWDADMWIDGEPHDVDYTLDWWFYECNDQLTAKGRELMTVYKDILKQLSKI